MCPTEKYIWNTKDIGQHKDKKEIIQSGQEVQRNLGFFFYDLSKIKYEAKQHTKRIIHGGDISEELHIF